MEKDTTLDVVILTPERILFEGKAASVVLPGEKGLFEVLPYHKKFLSRLVRGHLLVDGQSMPIRRGVAKVGLKGVTVIVEER